MTLEEFQTLKVGDTVELCGISTGIPYINLTTGLPFKNGDPVQIAELGIQRISIKHTNGTIWVLLANMRLTDTKIERSEICTCDIRIGGCHCGVFQREMSIKYGS